VEGFTLDTLIIPERQKLRTGEKAREALGSNLCFDEQQGMMTGV